MLVSIGSIVINLGVAGSMVRLADMGQEGLALTTSAVALFGFLVQFIMLRNRIGGIHGRALLAQCGRVVAASLAMAVVVWLSSRGMRTYLGVSQLARLADLAVSLPLGLAVYYAGAKALGLHEIDAVLRSFLNPLRRRFERTPL
jgi:peptidoglycan biosynthesis protein MviN/MurJ (putative lipid II flippase)